MNPVTTVAIITLGVLSGIGAMTVFYGSILIAQEIKDQRQRKAHAQRLTQGGSIKI